MTPSNPPTYNPREYWGGLLGNAVDLRAVGYPDLSACFNRWLYRGMAEAVRRALKILPPLPAGAGVLDVGSGSGFWVQFWRLMGCGSLTGVDLTAASIEHLRRAYPQYTFHQWNVGGQEMPAALSDRRFARISAMSILHHIPSQSAWEQGLSNLSSRLEPGGYLLIMDPMIRFRWWGKPFDERSTGYPRSMLDHTQALQAQGVVVERVWPVLTLLANPVDTRRRWVFRGLEIWWRLFSRVAYHESAMALAGPLVYVCDRLLCRLGFMPATKLLVCRKADR